MKVTFALCLTMAVLFALAHTGGFVSSFGSLARQTSRITVVNSVQVIPFQTQMILTSARAHMRIKVNLNQFG
ncbi:hypothetical protein RRG08_055478 [Elysia crispata]|uniref:Uncharacterized protein n=1 Tax=Elysia crispata TaxID=231223 RepID=A0AAE0Y1Q8_9GAST|nr:hypothetical protein RRG08_055478 [Elysia crispata]